MGCTNLEGPLESFLSTSNHNHLPGCLLVRHKCKESNGLILPWLKFASPSSLQIFIRLLPLLHYCPRFLRICLYGFVAQCNKETNIHHPITTCECFSYNITSFMSNLVCLKHQNFGSMSLTALVML
jgi:hypothetical protein